MSQCACIQEFDFDLIQTNCRDIIFIDHSTFQIGGNKTYTLHIESQSGTKTYTVQAGTPLHLDLGGCVDPSVYTFWAESCQYKVTKKAAIICTLWCGWLKSTAKIGRGVDSNTVKNIRENLEYISLIANTDYRTATELTKEVTRIIKSINCDCSC